MSEKRIKENFSDKMNILSLHTDIYPLIFNHISVNEFWGIARTCRSFKNLVYDYFLNNKGKDFWCFECKENLWSIHLQNINECFSIKFCGEKYCKKCYNKLPNCDECFLKTNIDDLVAIPICKNLTCFKNVCKKGCKFECDNCSRIETDSSYVYQGIGAETFICGDCKDDFEERYGWYYPSVQKYCIHSQ